MPKHPVLRSLLLIMLLFVAIQAVPYGRDHSNPPAVDEPAWPNPEVRRLAERACFDCHSHATRWPWYASVAPASWLLQRDVDEGRRKLNFSNWRASKEDAGEAAEEVSEGEMPPWFYLPLHPAAKLTDAEKATLVQGLQAMAGSGGRPHPGEKTERDRDD